jgi:hypothetical protein
MINNIKEEQIKEICLEMSKLIRTFVKKLHIHLVMC